MPRKINKKEALRLFGKGGATKFELLGAIVEHCKALNTKVFQVGFLAAWFVGDEMTHGQIISLKAAWNQHLSDFAEVGLLRKIRRGVYSLTEKGQQVYEHFSAAYKITFDGRPQGRSK